MDFTYNKRIERLNHSFRLYYQFLWKHCIEVGLKVKETVFNIYLND